MSDEICRLHKFTPKAQLTLGTTIATTPEIPIHDVVSLYVFIPQASSITQLTFYGAPRTNSELDPNTPANQPMPALLWYALFDKSGNALNINVSGGGVIAGQAGQAYDLGPIIAASGVCALGALKIVASPAGGQVEISMKA